MSDLRTSNRVQMGFPRGEGGRSEVRRRSDRSVLGYVRVVEVGASLRYFAEDASKFPIEGTFKTKSDAARAVCDAAGFWL